MLEWNNLLIDCFSHGVHILAIDIFDLPQLVLEIIVLQGPRRDNSQKGVLLY